MKKVIGLLILMLALAACGGADEAVVETAVDQVEEAVAVVEEVVAEEAAVVEVVEETAVEVVEEVAVAVDSGEEIRLQADYADALDVQSQLALGTLKLEDSPQAVDEAQAADLLPLWRAYQTLSESNITADVEMNALLNQIQGKMTTAQLQAIVALSLTGEDVATMLEDGTLSGAMRGGGNSEGDGSKAGGFGGGPGGGGGRSSELGEVDQDAIATRRAERFGDEDPEAAFQEMMLVGAVTQLLGVKTGEVSSAPGGFTIIFDTIAAELGMDVDALRTEASGDGTLADIIVANGGDVDAMHALLVTALADSDVASTQDDLSAFVTEVLNR